MPRTHRVARQRLVYFAKVGLALGLLGLAVGLACALVATRWISSLLFDVSALDATTFAGVAVFLLVMGLLTCVLPGRRAMRLDPAVILRTE